MADVKLVLEMAERLLGAPETSAALQVALALRAVEGGATREKWVEVAGQAFDAAKQLKGLEP